MTDQSRKIPAFIGVLWIAAAVIFVRSLPVPSDVSWLDLVVFCALAALSERWYVRITQESGMSLSFTIHFATAVLFGPAVAIAVAVVGLVIADGMIRRPPLVRTAFNIGQMAVSAGLCGLVYQVLKVDGPVDLVSDAPALAVSALVYLVVNDTLVAAVVSLTGHSFVREWRMSVKDLLLPYMSMAPLGALVAFAYQTNPWTLLYFPPLVLVIYEGFKLFVSLQRETDDALVALADSIDRRDKYTYQHSMRVAELVRTAADAWGLTPRETDLVVAAARVHDLGKIATDNRVLYKPTALNQDERRLIEQHAVEGEELAGRFSMFRDGRRFIRHHHERWDGTGYPDGLAGTQIPLGARLIAVADSFDAMMSDRPYRQAMSREAALMELRHCAGTQFDPGIVQSFIESLGGELADVAPALQPQSWPPEDIVAELSQGRDPAQLWAAAGLTISRLLDVPNCDIYRLDEAGDPVCVASVFAGEWFPEYLGRHAEAELWTIEREAIRTARPTVITSLDDARLDEAERADMVRWNEHSKAIVPLLDNDEVIGLVETGETRDGRTVTPDQLATTESICRLIAMAVHDAEVIDDQRLQARRLASLLESSRAVASAQSTEDALTVVTRRVGELFDVTRCVAYEFDEDLDAIVARAVWDPAPGDESRPDEPLALADHPVARDLLASGGLRTECASDPQLDPASRAAMELWGEKSRLTVPMQSIDGPMGLLTLSDSTVERRYTDDELALATSLAELAGEAVRGAKLLRRLRGLSETDPLTGLANRRKIQELLTRTQAQAQRYPTHFSVVMLDIDGFKPLNDTHGHPTGDAVLRQVAGLLKDQTRASDIVGRYGGDEFLLVLPETAPDEAAVLANKLRAELAGKPLLSLAGERIQIHASFGIAAYPQDGHDTNELIAAADTNLYVSKRLGGDAVSGGDASRPGDDDDGRRDDDDGGGRRGEGGRRRVDRLSDVAGPAQDLAATEHLTTSEGQSARGGAKTVGVLSPPLPRETADGD
jgi:diguanylate cyclase (GGDEF)-like protein/putative nucleotidyltransferase with HDIG domain